MAQAPTRESLAPKAWSELTRHGGRPQRCEGCPYGTRTCGPKGNPASPIVLVGESPGAVEAANGYPFAGPSGKVLHSCLTPTWEEDYYFLNSLQCLPKDKTDTDRSHNAILSCKPRLTEQIRQHPRKIIIAMGNYAVRSLTGNEALKITQIRGKLIPSPLAEHGIMPVVHPAFLLRGNGSYRKFKEDILYAIELARGQRPKQWIKSVHKVYDKPADIKRIIPLLQKKKYIAADIETSDLALKKAKLLSIGFSYTPEKVIIIPGELIKHVKPLLEHKGPRFIWHNGKFDVGILRQHKIRARVDEDTLLLSYALDETRGIHDLEQVASDTLGAPDYKHMVQPYLPNKQASYELIPRPVLYEYQQYDVSNTLQIFNIYRKRVAANPHLEKLYTKVLIPGSEMLTQVESVGMKFDTKQNEKNDVRLQAEIKKAEETFYKESGYVCNLNSSQQVCDVLYDKLKIPTKRRNTDKSTIKLLPRTPAVIALQEYRKVKKAHSTYVVGIRKNIQPDGAAHSSYLLHGTPTGRLASRDPNLQNIPRDAELRSTFCARSGKKLVEVDLNQAELRSLACLSNDAELVRIYTNSTLSLHKELSLHLFGKDYDHDQYMRAKAVNFGIVYGRTPPSIAEEFRIPLWEAQRMVEGWFERFPGAAAFIKKCRQAPLRGATMITPFGRMKRFGVVSREILNDIQNESANFPHQSIASDITLLGAIELQPRVKRWGVDIVNLIHDAILFECPDNPAIVNRLAKLAAATLEAIPPRWGLTRVPFLAEQKIGDRWGHLKEVPVGQYKLAA